MSTLLLVGSYVSIPVLWASFMFLNVKRIWTAIAVFGGLFTLFFLWLSISASQLAQVNSQLTGDTGKAFAPLFAVPRSVLWSFLCLIVLYSLDNNTYRAEHKLVEK